ncbi:MAG TPA: ABC transporter permease [Chitinophagaceae bacterium]|jgi:phospholipid/cholesterol/gamma-HCH transport system permease protein|nr:ABC transporter permease [Chitinophagaceae bacterium]
MLSKRSFSPALVTIADQTLFFKSFFRNSLRKGFEWEEFSRQAYVTGYRSIGIIALTGFILGFVLTLQSLPTMKQFGAVSYIPGMVSISVIREIGPVIVGLICAGKISSSIGAELGSMNVTEQIDAMVVSGANPMQYLVVTRILACTVMIPLLTIFADVMSLFGGFAASNLAGDMSATLYFYKSISVLEFADIIPSIIKTILFGFAIGFVGCYKGFNSNRGTESVGLAANSAVVTSSVWIIIIDAIVVQITNLFVYS